MSFSFCNFIIVKGWVLQISKRVDSNTPIPQLTNTYIFLLYKLYIFQIPHILFGGLPLYAYLTY